MGKSFILPSRVPGRGIVEITYILVAPLLPIMPDYGACEKVKANQDHPVWRGERRGVQPLTDRTLVASDK